MKKNLHVFFVPSGNGRIQMKSFFQCKEEIRAFAKKTRSTLALTSLYFLEARIYEQFFLLTKLTENNHSACEVELITRLQEKYSRQLAVINFKIRILQTEGFYRRIRLAK